MKELVFNDRSSTEKEVPFRLAPRAWLERVASGLCVGDNPDETECGRAYAALLLAEGP